MSKKIQFQRPILEAIAEHLQAEYPHEGCGFFAGNDGDSRLVKAWLPVRNMQEDQRERRFQIAPKDYLRAEQWADAAGLVLLGVYHSHPDHPATPSATDLESAVPWFSYLIVTTTRTAAGNQTSWQLDADGQFEEEFVEVLQAAPQVVAP
jgi:proteasome lid subunit RPN8/RPN11